MDLPPDETNEGEWWLCSPFEDAGGEGMARLLPRSRGRAGPRGALRRGLPRRLFLAQPAERLAGGDVPPELHRIPQAPPDQHLARWVRRRASHGFIDFAHVFRPHIRGVRSYWPAVATAMATLNAAQDTPATLHVAWDDRLVVRLNDDPPRDLGSQPAFRRRAVPVRLRQGANRLLLKLSNTKGRTWGAWCFSCRVVLPDGSQIIPAAGAAAGSGGGAPVDGAAPGCGVVRRLPPRARRPAPGA